MIKVRSIIIIFLFFLCSFLGGCSTEVINFSQGFLEGYNEQIRQDRYINNLIRLEKEKQQTYLLLNQ
ncbi:hypothetical protein OAQ96_01685 [Alphaproteobacteria bacterium]|nr:hypothetical protein [Alphaproteobacteria bacterium]